MFALKHSSQSVVSTPRLAVLLRQMSCDATAAPSPAYWDISYVKAGEADSSHSRFLRLHAKPDHICAPAHATVVVMHGGYWKNQYGLDDAYGNAGTSSCAPFFLQRGFSVVELEYRRRDHEGGGWPGTNEDILSAIRRLCELHAAACSPNGESKDSDLDALCLQAGRDLRLDRLVLLGHSAGGCLALWAAHHLAAGKQELRDCFQIKAKDEIYIRQIDETAKDPLADCKLALVLAMAPVADLIKGHEMRVSDDGDAVESYMKCTPEADGALEQYSLASPASLLPVTFPVLVACGDKDTDVPLELVTHYTEAAKSMDTSGYVTDLAVPGADHFDVVNTNSTAWKESIVPVLAQLMEKHIDASAAAAVRM